MRLAVLGARVYAATDRSVQRVRTAAREFIGGAFAQALDSQDLAEVTYALYCAAGAVNEIGLFPWERQWFDETSRWGS